MREVENIKNHRPWGYFSNDLNMLKERDGKRSDRRGKGSAGGCCGDNLCEMMVHPETIPSEDCKLDI